MRAAGELRLDRYVALNTHAGVEHDARRIREAGAGVLGPRTIRIPGRPHRHTHGRRPAHDCDQNGKPNCERGDEDPERELAEAQRQRDTADDLGEPAFTALGASAHFDRVLYDGGEFGASAEEEEFLGLPGLLEPEQVALLLRKRRADHVKQNAVPSQRARPAAAAAAAPAGPAAQPVPSGPGAAPALAPTREVLAALRKELNGLIAAWHHRTGQPHGTIHAELRRACGGPPLPEATAGQIRARTEMLRRWASGRS